MSALTLHRMSRAVPLRFEMKMHISSHSAPYLSDVISEPIFSIAVLVKASLDQCLDSLLRGWPFNRSNACIPPGSDFNIGRQTVSVDKSLDIYDCSLVEPSDSRCKRINKLI